MKSQLVPLSLDSSSRQRMAGKWFVSKGNEIGSSNVQVGDCCLSINGSKVHDRMPPDCFKKQIVLGSQPLTVAFVAFNDLTTVKKMKCLLVMMPQQQAYRFTSMKSVDQVHLWDQMSKKQKLELRAACREKKQADKLAEKEKR